MASPSLSSAFQFVKKYPITLCGLSLLFMPSVHHLLLYFTPLLLSTAIFVVAMVSWGPHASAERSSRRRPRLLDEHQEWTFDDGVGIGDADADGDGDGDEEEEEGADDGLPAVAMGEEASLQLLRQEACGNGGAHSDVGRSAEPVADLSRMEPDPDAVAMEAAALDRNCPSPAAMEAAAFDTNCPSMVAMDAAAFDTNCPSPAADGTGLADDCADHQACQAEPDPDVPDGSACAAHDDRCHDTCHSAIGRDGSDAHTQHANDEGGSLASSQTMGRGHRHTDDNLMRVQDKTAPAQNLPHCLQVCA